MNVLRTDMPAIFRGAVALDVAQMVLSRMAGESGGKLKAAKPAKKAIHITTELPGGKPRGGKSGRKR